MKRNEQSNWVWRIGNKTMVKVKSKERETKKGESQGISEKDGWRDCLVL